MTWRCRPERPARRVLGMMGDSKQGRLSCYFDKRLMAAWSVVF